MAHPSIYLPIYLSSVFYWFCFSWKAWLMKWILLFPFQESPERLYGTPLPTSHLAKSDRCRIQIQHFSASAQATKATSLLLYGIPTLCSVDPSLRSSSQIRYKHQVSWSQCLQGNQFTTPQVSSLKHVSLIRNDWFASAISVLSLSESSPHCKSSDTSEHNRKAPVFMQKSHRPD